MSMVERIAASRLPVAVWAVLVTAAAASLVAAMVPVGPDWLGLVGAVTVVSAYSWALAARTGGRPVVFGVITLAGGVAVAITDYDFLRVAAAVSTAGVASVLGVLATVPAVRFLGSVRECLIAFAIAGIGAMAAVGFEPAVTVANFEYTTFGLAFLGVIALVYRLGAGLHGLGRRGMLIVVVGGLLVALTLLYAELLRRYGTPGLVESSLDVVRWSREHLGAFPRPIETILGVPALAYGVHMRARRRQGWWVCAFGVAATSSVATSLANPAITLRESSLSVIYGLVIGLLIGWVVIRIDRTLTGSGGRARRLSESATAIRPEPRRTQALL